MINIKAVFLGFLADIAASMLFSVILGFIALAVLSAKGYQGDELETMLMQLFSGAVYMLISIVIGLGFTVMGGYIAGRIAKTGEYFHAGAVGALGLILGLFFMGQAPLWYNIAGFVLVIPAALLGGDMAKKRNSTSQESEIHTEI